MRVCVYCGSRSGRSPRYVDAARGFAAAAAGRGWDLVYGGGNVGLMGVVANEMLERGRHVVGVIPSALFEHEVAHRGVSELVEVGSMHERKAKMAELADVFVALPGGLGTLEELFEALTWTQLAIHAKPCALLDVDGYFGRLLAFLDHAVEERFVDQRSRSLLLVEDDADRLCAALAAHMRR